MGLASQTPWSAGRSSSADHDGRPDDDDAAAAHRSTFEDFVAQPSLPFALSARPFNFTTVLLSSLPNTSERRAEAASRSAAAAFLSDDKKSEAIRLAFKDSWDAYVQDAWGYDEYHPLSHSGSNWSKEGPSGYLIVDAIDSLLIMGFKQEYERARDWIRDELDFEKDGRFNVFETTIRTLGGLLSASALCTSHALISAHCSAGDSELFLSKAQDLAERLAPAFEATSTGIPLREVNLKTGESFEDADNRGLASLAEISSVQLEFKTLAHSTKTFRWWRLSERPMSAIRNALRTGASDGLLPIFINPRSGKFVLSDVRLGSRGDSYYEYLAKQWLITNRTEDVYRDMYDRAMSGIKKNLVKQSTSSNPPLLYTAEVVPRFVQGRQGPVWSILPKQDHLVCFLGGNLMLGALSSLRSPSSSSSGSSTANADWLRRLRTSDGELDNTLDQSDVMHANEVEDWALGHEIIRTCYDTYRGTRTRLAPEIAHFRMPHEENASFEDWYIKQPPIDAETKRPAAALIDARNILRPETVESLFIAYHLSGDPIYREWGWKIFESFVLHARVKQSGAFANVVDVMGSGPDGKAELEDRMETFWLAETLKYLYLLFSDQDLLPLDQWVFNTEAHPLPVFKQPFPTSFD
ncbi:glycoside hydrolase [Ceraceosorus guamensis]|uniref:alpha-1,2-Mannosidase n=1 Tax=Ceraceosorus guamensis TaxID=1522189 RepID=A0A316W0X5_9BASI|nr:glycoside hydrolase [Ceraceosorus guamensis]PWN41325.1 glycoside hydrolase [Ceraceosorus guamensis]